MITAHAHVGNVATALQLVDSSPVDIHVHNGRITVKYRNKTHDFESEFSLLLWIYKEIRNSAQESVDWFEDHREAFQGCQNKSK